MTYGRLLSILLFALPSVTASAQTWTYQGNSSCFHNGDNTQCLQSGTLQRYATSREQFESAYRNGQEIGQVVGVLIQAWAAHRHQLELERGNIREQISGYSRATYDLDDEISSYEKVQIAAYDQLAHLDPSRHSLYEQAENSAEVLISHLAQMKPMTEKNLPGILAAKDMAYLKSNLELSQKFYNQAEEMSKKEFVFSQLISGFAGSLEPSHASSQQPPALMPLRSVPIDSEPSKLDTEAENGDPKAQETLGKMYLDGSGVPQSFATAAKWLRLAANQGQAGAQLAIGELYEEGRGVVQDYVQAHLWYNLAAAAGVSGAEARRNALAAKMTTEQLAEAQKLASQWRPGTLPTP